MKRRTLPKPEAAAIVGHRKLRVLDQLLGEQHAPRLRHGDGRRAQMLVEQPAQLPLADAEPVGQRGHARLAIEQRLRAISASARETVFEVPRHAAASGEISGRQRRQGRKPASCAAAALGKKRKFSGFGVRAGTDRAAIDPGASSRRRKCARRSAGSRVRERAVANVVGRHVHASQYEAIARANVWPFSDANGGDAWTS